MAAVFKPLKPLFKRNEDRDFIVFTRQKAPGFSDFGSLVLHRSETSEAFFVLFIRILFNIKWKHGQGCVK